MFLLPVVAGWKLCLLLERFPLSSSTMLTRVMLQIELRYYALWIITAKILLVVVVIPMKDEIVIEYPQIAILAFYFLQNFVISLFLIFQVKETLLALHIRYCRRLLHQVVHIWCVKAFSVWISTGNFPWCNLFPNTSWFVKFQFTTIHNWYPMPETVFL